MTENNMESIQELTIKELTIKELFSGSDNYSIPIYQRNYAWKESHIVQLIDDINDYATQENNKKYYIGTLVVFDRENNGKIQYETIDGQQRLTTLFILLCVLKKHNKFNDTFKLNLKFESRENSSKTLGALYRGKDMKYNLGLNTSILQAYDDIKKSINKMNEDEVDAFQKYLLEKVKLLRVSVPKDTDLNHYFEIMNNRGEQLEKHEILKAKLLNILKDNKNETYIFNLIWEACSNMEKYVQYGFNRDQRNKLFGKKWNELKAMSFDDISKLIEIPNRNNQNKISSSISDLINSSPSEIIAKNIADPSDRFTSPINFSNFLLQVLRIQTGEDIPLDDKRLLKTFETYYSNDKKETFVKEFGYKLLQLKFLSDKYIIKREFLNGNDGWSLKQLQISENGKSGYYKNTFDDEGKNEDKNQQILMLLSMFHVSAPTLIYKHWFSAALKFISEKNNEIKDNDYLDYLGNLAESYLHNRYLAKQPLDYYKIIFTNKGEKQECGINKDLLELDKGTDVENFIFNYLDYLLWKENITEYRNFEFTFRSSIEHYYPQHPIENIEKLDDSTLNNFGNLCLISRSQNSKLSNLPPEAKKAYYQDNKVKDSIKQGIMMQYEKWTKKEIEEHGEKMKKALLRD